MLTLDSKETERLAQAIKCAFCGKTPLTKQHIVMCASSGHGGVIMCDTYDSTCPGIQHTIPVCDSCFASYEKFCEE